KVTDAELAQPPAPNAAGFRCSAETCTATAAGALIVHAANAASAQPLCDKASLIVIDDAAADNPCPAAGPTVVTKRDLAAHGAASVSFDGGAAVGRPSAQITFAIDQPYR